MTDADPHSWDVTPARARELQAELASRVIADRPFAMPRFVAAADVSFGRYDKELAAAVVVVEIDGETARVVERVGVVRPIGFPYVPGLLSFREAPGLLDAFDEVLAPFEVVLCDGQGIAHPRRLGIASHLGLRLDRPTVGCAKSRLTGTYDEPGSARGDRSPLMDGGETIGAVIRTKNRVNPLFVSPGHRADLESSVALVLATSGRYRLPAPARLAHAFVNEVRRAGRGIVERT